MEFLIDLTQSFILIVLHFYPPRKTETMTTMQESLLKEHFTEDLTQWMCF